MDLLPYSRTKQPKVGFLVWAEATFGDAFSLRVTELLVEKEPLIGHVEYVSEDP